MLARYAAEPRSLTCTMLCILDPKQLPPTLPGHDEGVKERKQRVGNHEELTGLSRTLFVRLRDAGADTMMLRTQYRSVETNKAEHADSRSTGIR